MGCSWGEGQGGSSRGEWDARPTEGGALLAPSGACLGLAFAAAVDGGMVDVGTWWCWACTCTRTRTRTCTCTRSRSRTCPPPPAPALDAYDPRPHVACATNTTALWLPSCVDPPPDPPPDVCQRARAALHQHRSSRTACGGGGGERCQGLGSGGRARCTARVRDSVHVDGAVGGGGRAARRWQRGGAAGADDGWTMARLTGRPRTKRMLPLCSFILPSCHSASCAFPHFLRTPFLCTAPLYAQFFM